MRRGCGIEIIAPYALAMAAVGLTETLLTQQLVDELTETRSSTHLECIGQGLANIVCGLFGGLGGCAMIGQTMVNVKSGGAKRLSGITCSLFIMLFIVVASPIIEAVPLAALVGCANFPPSLSSPLPWIKNETRKRKKAPLRLWSRLHGKPLNPRGPYECRIALFERSA